MFLSTLFITLFSNFLFSTNAITNTTLLRTNIIHLISLNTQNTHNQFDPLPIHLYQLNLQNNCTLNGDTINTKSQTCSYNGICTETGYCNCDYEYATYPDDAKKQCNYNRKSRLTAILLHLFFGLCFGGGEYYLGNTDLGTIQLLLFLPLIFLISVISAAICQKDENVCGKSLTTMITLAMFIFWIVDLVKIIDGSRKDGNGVSTYE